MLLLPEACYFSEILEKEVCPALLKCSFDYPENASFFKEEHRLEVITVSLHQTFLASKILFIYQLKLILGISVPCLFFFFFAPLWLFVCFSAYVCV